MAKYIDSEAAYRFAQDQMKKETGAYSRGWNYAMNVMKGALHNNDAIPAADVVPVVRCRDCKHRDPEDRKCDYGGLEHAHMFPVADDWFCADGEKREVEHD